MTNSTHAETQSPAEYRVELDAAVASITTMATYSADVVFGWMKTWGTDHEKSFADADLPAVSKAD